MEKYRWVSSCVVYSGWEACQIVEDEEDEAKKDMVHG